LHLKVAIQTGNLEGRVIGSLNNSRVIDSRDNPRRQLLPHCQIDDGHWLVVEGIGKQHDLEVIRLCVLMHAALFQVNAAISLKVNA
jgi:hypothetical protein